MAAAPVGPLVAMEVPIATGEGIKWIDVTVPSSAPSPPPDSVVGTAPAIRHKAASCNVVSGNPPAYLFWRIHENLPNILEVVEIFACNEHPETGLHLVFHEVLHNFAFLCKNEAAEGDAYLLYVLTVSGTAYLLNLKRPFNFLSGSIFPQSELIEFSVQNNALDGKVTAVAATPGCLLIGRQDGSVGCYQLGALDPSKPGFMYELRDDDRLGRLWNLMSRVKAVGAVQDMVISEVCTRKLLFVLHSDGIMRSWDLFSHARVLNHSLSSSELTGTTPSRLWVGCANYDTNVITLAVLHVSDIEVITVYNFGINVGEKNILSPEPLLKTILLDKGRLVDLKISSEKLWILKEDGSLFYELSDYDYKVEHASNYGLQEDFIADQLFQSSEHALDDLVWTNISIFSAMKEVVQFVSSIFLQRLLQPGICHNAALRAMLLDQRKYLSDFEFQSFSSADLRKEVFTVVNAELNSANSSSVVCCWKDFCTRYFRYWCQYNVPYGLFFDTSNNVLGLIRKNSFSLFRSLEGIEKLIYGSSDEFHELKSGLLLPTDNVESEMLYEILRCTSHINHQIGRAASAVFYESFFVPSISTEDVIFHLLKILETGYYPLLSAQAGEDATSEKRQSAHRSLRNFSVDMLLSFHALHSRATNWAGVLDVFEKYLEYLKPHRSSQKSESEGNCSVNFFLLVQATSQVARVMFETAFDVLLLLGYLINASGQVSMMQGDITRIKAKLIPAALEILTQWLVLHFMATTSTSPSVVDDFSSRLSLLQIGSKADKRQWDGKLSSSGCTLALLLGFPCFSEGETNFLKSFLSTDKLIQSVWKFTSLVVRGVSGNESSIASIPIIELASLLLRHGQYEAAENLFLILDAYSNKAKVSLSSWHGDSGLCKRLHLLGFCLLMRAHSEVDGELKKHKILEAVRSLFRAASFPEASQSLQNLYAETGFLYSGESESTALWRLHYYQWAMLIFDQHAMSEGACQFALAALEQADEIIALNDGNMDDEFTPELASTIRGQLWANVFKFCLDLKNYRDAYCAIVSNPDEDSKYICLRRFVIVLCEHGATKVLCDGKLPFVGMTEKVEQELFWKAERSDIFARPNLYKLLYSFQAYRNNWRKAASYIYQYSVRLKNEVITDDTGKFSTALQERLEGLSAAINALQLVDHASAWIDSKYVDSFSTGQGLRHKRARNVLAEKSAFSDEFESERLQYNVDIKMLEKEYVLTSAQYLLSHVKDKINFSGNQKLSHLVDILIKENFYDMAFIVILTFWKGSTLNRELEQAFIALSEKFFSGGMVSSALGSIGKGNNFLLPSPDDLRHTDGRIDSSSIINFNSSSMINQIDGNGHWETLQFYLEKYKKIHQRLPVVVAETLLYGDPQIELPFWLVNMFKAGRKASSWGMTGQQPDPATLFRLYIDYGRLAEATNLLLEYLESFATLSAADAIKRKKMSAIWFPYAAIERLWCQLQELCSAGHMVGQCDKLKSLLQGALLNHLKQVKVDSEDVVASAAAS
ncbi:nuclear pore complex protein NUP160 [Phalaenopsis equestris]|uniref:nuclear pore complex protein NUP160 n=1 Tax=Phalaenopsis equestris TaxID=78828 RepID=UPI0009E43898|nr:nuclear pore complex protein NUP160 [Phalaenopsis equestris]